MVISLKDIYYHPQKSFLRLDLETLYKDTQWYAYTTDMPLLESALSNSLSVISAWNNNSLVGLVRFVVTAKHYQCSRVIDLKRVSEQRNWFSAYIKSFERL